MNDEIVNKNYTLYYRLCLTDLMDDNPTNSNSTTTFPDCSELSRTDPIWDAFGQEYVNNDKVITQESIDRFFGDIVPTKTNDLPFLASFGPDFMETNFTRYYRMFFRFGFISLCIL